MFKIVFEKNKNIRKKTIQEKPFIKQLIPWIIVAIMLYTIAAIVLQFYGHELSPTLTTAYFSFWGVELIAIATIKVTKTRNKSKDESEE